ncbi:very large A-kinase anchor protein isoform X2 [Xenopus tropicalis]|uniref:Very large A-kinase anchor protein isoform X2 n=1 Tax=Xenopus tropicalis TaxID=8364 RepID=A0A8J1J3K8_XENTR|nr:very large A-kinase anchor protein isoform X2 [Xenopus tropicalis]
MPIRKKPTSWQEDVARGFSRFFSRSSSQEREEEAEKTSGDEQEQADSTLSRFFSRASSSQEKDKKLANEKSALEESTEGHQSPSRFFSRASSTQEKDKKLANEKSALEESTEGHQSPSRFFSRASSTQEKDKKLANEKSALEESTEGHQSPSRFFSRASSTQEKDKKLANEKSALEESTEGHQSPSRFFFRGTTPDKEAKDKSFTPEEQEKGLNLSKLFYRGTPQGSNNVSNTEEPDSFSSMASRLSVTFSQEDESGTVKSKTSKINLSSQEDKSPITVRDNKEHLPHPEADQNKEEESRTDWNHDAKSLSQEKQPKEKIREFFGQLFSFTSKSPVASPKQTPGNQEPCRESQDEPVRQNLEEEFVGVEQRFQEPDPIAQATQATEDGPASREIDLGASDNKQTAEVLSQEQEESPAPSPIPNTSNLEPPSITYGTYRGSKKIRKLLRRRADVNSPILEKEEVPDTETTTTLLDYSTDSDITPYPTSHPDVKLHGGPNEETSENSNKLPPNLERNTKSEESFQLETHHYSYKKHSDDVPKDTLCNSETVTLIEHGASERTISQGLEPDGDDSLMIPDNIQNSGVIKDLQPDMAIINNNNKNSFEANNVEALQNETQPQVEIAADADKKSKTITVLQHDAGEISNITNVLQPDEVNFSKTSGISLSLTDNNSNIISNLETVNKSDITKPLHEFTSITSIYQTDLQSDKEENWNAPLEPKVDTEKDSEIAAGLQTSPVGLKAQQTDASKTSILGEVQQITAADVLDISLGLQEKTEKLSLIMDQQPCAEETFKKEETSAQNTQSDSMPKMESLGLVEQVHPSSNSKINNNTLVNIYADIDDSTKNNETEESSLHAEAKIAHETLPTSQITGHLGSDNDNNSVNSDGGFEHLQHNEFIISQSVQSQVLDSPLTDESYKNVVPQSSKNSVCVKESLHNVNLFGKPDISDIPDAAEVPIAANNNISDDHNKHHNNVPPDTDTSFNFSASFSDDGSETTLLHDEKCKSHLITDYQTNNIGSLSNSSLNEENIREALDVDSIDEGHFPTFAIPSTSSSFASAYVDEQCKSSLPSSDSVDSGLISPACTPDENIIYNDNKLATLDVNDQGNNTIVEPDKTVYDFCNVGTIDVKNTSQVDNMSTTEEVSGLSETNTIQGTNVVTVNNISPRLENDTTTAKTAPTLKERIGKLSSNQISQPNSKDVYIAKVSVKSIDVKEVKIAPYNFQSEIITITKLPTPTFEPEYIQLSVPSLPPMEAKNDLQEFQQEQDNEKVTTIEKSSFRHFKPKSDNSSKVEPDTEAVQNILPALTNNSPDVTIENIKNNNFTALMRSSNDNFMNMSSLTGTHDNDIDKILLSTCVSELETKDVNLQGLEPKETNIYSDFSLQAKVNSSNEMNGTSPSSPTDSTIPEKDTMQLATEHSALYDTLLQQKANELICTVLNKAVEEMTPNNSTLNTISTTENGCSLLSPVSEANDISNLKSSEHGKKNNECPNAINDTSSKVTDNQMNDLLSERKLESQNQIHTEKTEDNHMPSTIAELGSCGNDQVDHIPTGSFISLSNENSDIGAIMLNSANVEGNAVLDNSNVSVAVISNEAPTDLEIEIPITQSSSLGMLTDHSNEAEIGKIFISNNSELEHENDESNINESDLHSERIPKELRLSDDTLLSSTSQNDRTNVDEINHSTNELLTQTSDEATKVDQAKKDTNRISSTSQDDRTNVDKINHLTNELLTQSSDEALKVEQATNELSSISQNDRTNVDKINHLTNELLTQSSVEALKVDQATNELSSISQNNEMNQSANELLTQKPDEPPKVYQTKEDTNELQNCEKGDRFVASDIIEVNHSSCDNNSQHATNSGPAVVSQENAFADELYQNDERIYPTSNDPFVSMANKIVSDTIFSAKQNVISSMLQTSLNKNIDGKIQSETSNTAQVGVTGTDNITTQSTQNSDPVISLCGVGKEYNITSELTNTDGEQNQYILNESKNTFEGTVHGRDIITEMEKPTDSPHLAWSLGTDEDSHSYEGLNNTGILKNTEDPQTTVVNYLGLSGEVEEEAVNMGTTDFFNPFQFSIHQANIIEISENDEDQDNNECYVCDSEESSDSYVVVQARRRRFYPFSLSPIYEDESSSEDILSTSASPKHTEADQSDCNSILTLLQSVSARLKQTNALDKEEVFHEECHSLADKSSQILHEHSNMDAAEKLEDTSKAQVVDQPILLPPQIPTRSSLFITKTMPEIKSLTGAGRQSILMQLTKKPFVLNSKPSGEALSPTAPEECPAFQKIENSNVIKSNFSTESAPIQPSVYKPVEESNELMQKNKVETNSHLESTSVHFHSNLNSQNYSSPPETKTISCQENVDTLEQDDLPSLPNLKSSVPPALEHNSSLQEGVDSSFLNPDFKTEVVSNPLSSTSQTASESVLPIQIPDMEHKSQHTMLQNYSSPSETGEGDFQKLGSSQQNTQAPLMSAVHGDTVKHNPRPGKVVISDILDHENKTEVNADIIDASSWIFPNGVNIRVIRGCWTLYEKPNFEGLAHVLEEGEAELTYLWEVPQSTSEPNTIKIGSIKRIVKDYIPEIILLPQYPITGSSIHLLTEVPTIESLTYHMHHSLVVKSGVWLAYSQPQFSGSVTVLEEGSEIPKIQEYGIRSVRPLKMGGLKVQMPSDPKIILYGQPCFQGWSRELTEHIYSIKSLLSDGDEQEIGSVRVLGGIWVGYDMERFKGRQYLLEEGEYPDWQSWGGINSSLQSMRYLQADFMEASVTLYESDREDMKQLEAINLGIPDVEQAGYGPETQSIHVKKGMWVAYEQKHFCGQQYILEKGRYKSCADWGGHNNTIMSLRPVLLEPYGSNDPKHLIKAYSGLNFQGESVDLTQEVTDFKAFTPSSFKVLRGCWLLCYQGDMSDNLCVLEEGHFPDMASCGCPAAVIKFIQPIDYVFAEPSISLFALDSCEGRELHFEEAVNSVLSRDLHFYTQSVWVRSGLWIAYEEANFLGRQILLEAKKILNWAEFSGWKAIGSLRPLKQPAVYVRIKNRHNNKYLTVTGKLADTRAMSVCVSPRNGQYTQIWHFCRGLMKSKASDSCLDVIGGKNIPGSKVSLWQEHGKLRQKWRINKDGTITSCLSDELALDLKGGNYYDQNHIVVNHLQPNLPSQKWDVEIL